MSAFEREHTGKDSEGGGENDASELHGAVERSTRLLVDTEIVGVR
jgi:hypothetical protein